MGWEALKLATFKLVSWNVRGLMSYKDLSFLVKGLVDNSNAIVFVGETGFRTNVLDDRFRNLLVDYECFLCKGISRYTRCMLLVPLRRSFLVVESGVLLEGYGIWCQFQVMGKIYLLCGVVTPQSYPLARTLFSRVSELIRTNIGMYVLVGGDLTVPCLQW